LGIDTLSSAASFQQKVLIPIARYGKKESLLQALNIYFNRFNNYDLEGIISLILRNAAESGNIDIIDDVLSNYGTIFDKNDLTMFKISGVYEQVLEISMIS
jgi:hypothetical protein